MVDLKELKNKEYFLGKAVSLLEISQGIFNSRYEHNRTDSQSRDMADCIANFIEDLTEEMYRTET